MKLELVLRCVALLLTSMILTKAIFMPTAFGLWLQKIDTARFSYPAIDSDQGPSLE